MNLLASKVVQSVCPECREVTCVVTYRGSMAGVWVCDTCGATWEVFA